MDGGLSQFLDADGVRHAGAFAFSPDFPIIEHIDDVGPQIRPEVGIYVKRWGDHLVINYAVSMPETFLAPIDIECRGLVFHAGSGLLRSRPLVKTFNLGERLGVFDLDFTKDNWVEKKLDGSMIGAFVEGDPATGEVMFHTRGGFSDQAKAARSTASDGVVSLVRDAYGQGFTPVFEWTSPRNRIVVAYAQESLTLLAMRDRRTGVYLSRAELERFGRIYGVPVVAVHAGKITSVAELQALIAEVRAMKGEEGVMLVFADGNRPKIKSEEYLTLHRAVSDLGSEKNVIRLWLDDAIDDVSAMIDEDRGRMVRDYGARLDRMAMAAIAQVEAALAASAQLEPKARAFALKDALPKQLQAMAFAMAKGQDGLDQVKRIVAWGFGSLPKMAEVRGALDLPRWELDIASVTDGD